MLRRRLMTTAVATVAAGLLASGPALAHFCMKTAWNEAAQEKAANSQAWVTADDWREFLAFAVEEGFICEEGVDILTAALDEAPEDALFHTRTLLAAGNSPAGPAGGKGKNPDHFDYLPVMDAFEACGEPDNDN